MPRNANAKLEQINLKVISCKTNDRMRRQKYFDTRVRNERLNKPDKPSTVDAYLDQAIGAFLVAKRGHRLVDQAQTLKGLSFPPNNPNFLFRSGQKFRGSPHIPKELPFQPIISQEQCLKTPKIVSKVKAMLMKEGILLLSHLLQFPLTTWLLSNVMGLVLSPFPGLELHLLVPIKEGKTPEVPTAIVATTPSPRPAQHMNFRKDLFFCANELIQQDLVHIRVLYKILGEVVMQLPGPVDKSNNHILGCGPFSFISLQNSLGPKQSS
ncbi:hypothetical protein LIER_42405 [Lithospermum erythrorhizon]|uniref:Uncharacterized protein n=1 Tax=Lithospermum erythrorhizon TaxID=34254 RepID=A0AAV3RP39_LITER